MNPFVYMKSEIKEKKNLRIIRILVCKKTYSYNKNISF